MSTGDLYARYQAEMELVPERQRDTVRELHAQAIGYVWGWQDARAGEDRDTGYSLDFGHAYAITAARYESERAWFRISIGDAFQSWREHGEIRDRSNGICLHAEKTYRELHAEKTARQIAGVDA